MRIALFGGSFDPPHVAHQMACLYTLATQDIDQIWMIPCFRHPFDKRSAPFSHRVAMCRLAAAPLGPRVCVSTVEEDLGGQSYTLVTLKHLMARHPRHEFFLLVGADLVTERERWYGWPELSRLGRFIVVGRAGVRDYEAEAGDATDAAPELELPAVSSTQIRAELGAGRAPRERVPREVLDYIRQHDLYRLETPA